MLQVYGLTVLFAVFAALVNGVLPRKVRYIWLLVCSVAFYLWCLCGMPLAVPVVFNQRGFLGLLWYLAPAFLLLCIVAALCWACGFFVCRVQKLWLRVLILCSGLVFAILPLVLRTVFTVVFPPSEFAQPLGVEFYSLIAAGYIMDVYTRRANVEENPARFTAFLALFCSVLTGPVNRAAKLIPQIKNPPKLTYNKFSGGFFRMCWGIFKKILIADNLAVFTAFIMENPTQHTAPVLVVFLALFALQLTCTLSAACDIAVGTGDMLGLTLAENFRSPFTARSIGRFAKRWMSGPARVFKDTAAIPVKAILPKKKRHTRAVMAVTWFFGVLGLSLWLGGTAYLVWGLVFGALVCASIFFEKKRNEIAIKVPVYRLKAVRAVLCRLWVFFVFTALGLLLAPAYFGQPLAGWAFRLTTGWNTLSANFIYERFLRSGLTELRLIALFAAVVMWLVLEGFAAVKQHGTIANWMRRRKIFIRWPIYAAMLLGCVFFGVV